MNIESYSNSGSLKSFSQIFLEWENKIIEYLEYFRYGDCPWYYNERATLSTFAAAIWVSGGIALEEFATRKGRTRESWSGRCDLYIGLNSRNFNCEAKQVFCSIGKRSVNRVNYVKFCLTNACKDVKQLNKNEAERLGICFAIPYLPKSEIDFVDDRIMHWQKEIQDIDYDAIAWVFPKKSRNIVIANNGYLYPGVVVLLKNVD